MAIHRSGPEDAPLAAYHCTTCERDSFRQHPRLQIQNRLLPITPAQATGRALAEMNVADHDSAYPNHRILLLRFWPAEKASASTF